MATLKHINSKNADYGAAEQYLLFEHDEFTMKPVLDETGRLIPREDYRLSTLNCGGEDFAVACMRANLRYEKNQRREDVKSHHYIISFDPRDGPDNGLTVDRAQALGEQFCKEHFPGHQALVCTHPDGHNHSGNNTIEIWKRFRKWGGMPTGITQNVKDLLSSREVENIFENSDYIYMLNQASGDRQILAKQLNISPHQLSYVTHSGEGEGLLFYGNIILPFVDRFPKDTELYRVLTTKPQEVSS